MGPHLADHAGGWPLPDSAATPKVSFVQHATSVGYVTIDMLVGCFDRLLGVREAPLMLSTTCRMALIQTCLPPEVLCTKAEDTKLAADAALVLKAPSMEPLQARKLLLC